MVDLESTGQPIETLVAAATWTIVLSVVLHGLTAQPLSAWYADRVQQVTDKTAQLVELKELRFFRRRSTASYARGPLTAALSLWVGTNRAAPRQLTVASEHWLGYSPMRTCRSKP